MQWRDIATRNEAYIAFTGKGRRILTLSLSFREKTFYCHCNIHRVIDRIMGLAREVSLRCAHSCTCRHYHNKLIHAPSPWEKIVQNETNYIVEVKLTFFSKLPKNCHYANAFLKSYYYLQVKYIQYIVRYEFR